jgi:hypothetical protein
MPHSPAGYDFSSHDELRLDDLGVAPRLTEPVSSLQERHRSDDPRMDESDA